MEKYVFDDISEIIMFRSNSEEARTAPPLNEFIAYLKYHRVMGPYKFTYVGIEGSLIQELTLKQNLLLDYTSASLSEEKEVHFKNYLKNKPNIHLEALYNMILNLNDIPKNATKEEIKLVSLIRALISEAPFIFLENPESDLSTETFKLFQEALRVQIEISNQNVFLVTQKESNWTHFVTKIVTRNKDYSFKTTLQDKDANFKIEKEKFFHEPEEKANQSHLVFKVPKKNSKAINKKKTA